MRAVNKKLILLELNEVNFDIVEEYVRLRPDHFPSLKKMLSGPRVRTTSEEKHEFLEPWIQWPSVHTGMTYSRHGIFRLGDMVASNVPQIFELLEEAGYKVGAISAMNVVNRLKKPAYFIPDPWTQTLPDDTWWSRSLSQAISQTVNDNARARISVKSFFQIGAAFARFGLHRHSRLYHKLFMKCRSAPWLKAVILDLLLHDVHWSLFHKKNADFSVLFLNAGAHIQHHYFFNAAPIKKLGTRRNPEWYVSQDTDPIEDFLKVYDLIVGEYFALEGVETILATGLSQDPYDRVEFFYRLVDHGGFLDRLGIVYQDVYPRMTRDFLIEFCDASHAESAKKTLAAIRVAYDGLPLFGEIDNRGDSLFVTLTYPNEIFDDTFVVIDGVEIFINKFLSFVAVKNGMHDGKGFSFFTPQVAKCSPVDNAHVCCLFQSIAEYFDLDILR